VPDDILPLALYLDYLKLPKSLVRYAGWLAQISAVFQLTKARATSKVVHLFVPLLCS
jgi:hypothetical protein